MWPEIQIAKKEKRRELVLSGAEISQRIQKDGLDPTVYTLSDLNFLSLTDTHLTELNSSVASLENLQTLILHTNKIDSVAADIGKLTKLKILDLSSNNIKNVPDSVSVLPQIVTLNFAFNKLESFPELSINSKLTVLDLSNNCLKEFPKICNSELSNLSEVKLHGNQITDIPYQVCELPALKLLDVSSNMIKILPGELADCSKLKEVNLKSNPLSDRRLQKLVDQCRTKQIIDYLKQHGVRCSKPEESQLKNGKKGNKKRLNSTDSLDEDVVAKYTITVKPFSESFSVQVEDSVKSVREHIVCCLINNVKFTEESFKDFIRIQNRLHDGICAKRSAATIATHDFNKVSSNIVKYTALPPKELKIQPLNRPRECSGEELFGQLQREAEQLRKEKKRSTYSGIHKYLHFIEGKPLYPCLINELGNVISFPPIVNSSLTMITVETTRIFVEITSSNSQLISKQAMTELLKATVVLLGPQLEVQQVRVLDKDSKLKLVFPSKSDLEFEPKGDIKVVRE